MSRVRMMGMWYGLSAMFGPRVYGICTESAAAAEKESTSAEARAISSMAAREVTRTRQWPSSAYLKHCPLY